MGDDDDPRSRRGSRDLRRRCRVALRQAVGRPGRFGLRTSPQAVANSTSAAAAPTTARRLKPRLLERDRGDDDGFRRRRGCRSTALRRSHRVRSSKPRRPLPFAGSAPPMPSSAISTRRAPSACASRHARVACVRVARDVGQRLGAEEVRRCFDARRQPALELDVELDGKRHACCQSLERWPEAVLCEDRRMDAARELA